MLRMDIGGHRESPARTGARAKPGRDDESVEPGPHFGDVNEAIETRGQVLADFRQQLRPGADHSAANENALRSHRHHQNMQQLGQCVSHRIPHRTVVRQVGRVDTTACRDGRTGSKALDAWKLQ